MVIAHDTYERADDDNDEVSEGVFLTFHESPDALRNARFATPFFQLPSLRSLDLLLLRLCRPLVLAAFATIRVRHLVVASTALVGRVVLFCHVRIRVRLEIFVEAFVVFIGRATVSACSDDFFLRGVDIRVVERCLNEGGGLATVSTDYSITMQDLDYVVKHLVAYFQILCCKKILQRLLLFSAPYVSKIIWFAVGYHTD